MNRSRSLTIWTTRPVEQALRDLVATGLFGETVEEAAEQLLRERVREVELRFNLPSKVRRKAPKGVR